MKHLSRFRLIAGLILFFSAACTPKIIPDDILEKVDQDLTFEAILDQPDRHLGKIILLGGEIIEIRNLQENTEIEILQKPLDAGRAPRFSDTSKGRFFVIAPSFLDPALYKSGRRITVIGRIKGSRLRKFKASERQYPLLEKEHLTLWPQEQHPLSKPTFSFGFGAVFRR